MEQVFEQAAGFSPRILKITLVGITLTMLSVWVTWVVSSIVRAYGSERINLREAIGKALVSITIFVTFFYYIAWLGVWR